MLQNIDGTNRHSDDDERRHVRELSMAIIAKRQRPAAMLADVKVALARAGVRPGDDA